MKNSNSIIQLSKFNYSFSSSSLLLILYTETQHGQRCHGSFGEVFSSERYNRCSEDVQGKRGPRFLAFFRLGKQFQSSNYFFSLFKSRFRFRKSMKKMTNITFWIYLIYVLIHKKYWLGWKATTIQPKCSELRVPNLLVCPRPI